ncbi:MAG: SUMF1/EgtB/PvdO family nonheme iron enzyme [Saprospiraceae bacterium]|nr:SUMF1/EgtB/PvdO family nonheme iron enzyme [Saprospiraceae bacterium]
MAATKPLFDIAPSIKGIVQSAGNAGFLKDFSADFKQFQANTPTPLPDVQIRGAGVNTRTDAKGNYTLKLPPQYPNATIVLTFTKEGFNTVTQTFTIDKVKQLPTVRLVSNATKPVEPTKKDGSTTTPPSPKAPSVGTGKDTTVTAQNTAQNTAASESIFAPTMVDVKGGTFQMGSNEYDDEKPIHSVTVSDFAIGKYEVTQKQWRDVMGSDPPELNFKGCDQCPVENVSWNDIQEFLQKLNQKTGKKYRLPTEAEWEYAARGGNKSRGYTYSGSNTVGDVAWYTDNSGYKTHPVGTKGANELGIHDMSGNVWEWCSDWYGDYSNAAVSNPMGAAKGSYRVFRGGSWLRNAVLCRVASRNNSTPTARSLYLGFRLALSSLQ